MSHSQKSEAAFVRLRQEILSGALAPGSAVSETAIAARYETGRASARSALQRLAQQSLVTVMPRRGYVIARITIGDVREILEMRMALEPLAARIATGRMDAGELLERERKALAAWRRHRSTSAEVLAHNRYIHMRIAEASGNSRLIRQIDELLAESERAILVGLANGTLVSQMMDEHMPLLEALRSGDPDLAEERARQHIETTMHNTMDGFLRAEAVRDQPIHAAHP